MKTLAGLTAAAAAAAAVLALDKKARSWRDADGLASW